MFRPIHELCPFANLTGLLAGDPVYDFAKVRDLIHQASQGPATKTV
jgi:hypothetical protein